MDDVVPICPLCLSLTDEPKLPCAACNETLPPAVQDWFQKAWIVGTVATLTYEEVGEALRAMCAVCWLADDPYIELAATWRSFRETFLPLRAAESSADIARSSSTARG